MFRIAYAVRFGEQCSKDAAARWMEGEAPGWAWLIRKALTWRRGERDEGAVELATFGETARFVRFVADRLVAP